MRFRLELTVKPGSKMTALERDAAGSIRIRLNAPAVEGKANKALVRFLSDSLDLPQSAIEIGHGLHGRKKTIFIEATSLPEPYLSMATISAR